MCEGELVADNRNRPMLTGFRSHEVPHGMKCSGSPESLSFQGLVQRFAQPVARIQEEQRIEDRRVAGIGEFPIYPLNNAEPRVMKRVHSSGRCLR